MRVRIKIWDLPKHKKEFLKYADLPYSKYGLKTEFIEQIEKLKNDREARAGLLRRIQGWLKKKIYDKEAIQSLEELKERYEDFEIFDYKIINETENSIEFEIEMDEYFFLTMDYIKLKIGGVFSAIFKKFFTTKKEFISHLHSAIRRDYGEKYTLEVIE